MDNRPTLPSLKSFWVIPFEGGELAKVSNSKFDRLRANGHIAECYMGNWKLADQVISLNTKLFLEIFSLQIAFSDPSVND